MHQSCVSNGWAKKVGNFMRSKIFESGKRLCIAILFGATACSKVSFVPTNPVGDNSSSIDLPDGTRKDSFTFNNQNGMAKVDILIVDDNSPSMSDKQLKMQAGLATFITSLGSVDWQIGITTTDTSTGTYGVQGSLIPLANSGLKILNRNVSGFQSIFETAIVRTEIGSPDERPHLATMEAIAKRSTNNQGFFRAGADLAVIMLTDEDEASDGGPTANLPADAVNTFASAFGTTKQLTVFGIILEPGDTTCFNLANPTGSTYGNLHAQLIQLTGGVMGSICDTNYGPTLSKIGDHVINGIRQITLSLPPDTNTLHVVITPDDPSLTWTVSGQVVTFNKPPGQGTHVDVIYNHL